MDSRADGAAWLLVREILALLRESSSIHAGDAVQVLCALLCLKRIGDRDGSFCVLSVPPELRWTALLERGNLGAALNAGCRALEDQNPELQQTLSLVDFTSASMGAGEQRQVLLVKLVRLIMHVGPSCFEVA
jgi:hypothetical protein